MREFLNYLLEHTWKIVIAYVIIQILLVIFWSLPFKSDSLYYYKLAQTCIANHSFYPAKIQLYNDYISAPLYINLLILILKVYNSTFSIGILNILLNCLQLFFVYKITNKLFGLIQAKISILIYIFYLNTLGLIIMNMTEFLFGVLVLASIYFFIQNNIKLYFLAGVFAAASIGVRPLGWALIISYVIVIIYRLAKRKISSYKLFLLILGFALFLFAFGFYTQSYFGRFVFTSTNGSANLLIGANDNATGAFNSKVFEKGNAGYIGLSQYKTYVEKDTYWRDQAFKWIKEHPFKWISLIPAKFVYLFVWDDYSIAQMMHLPDWNLYLVVKYILTGKSFNEILDGNPWYTKIIYFLIQFLNQLYYLFILYFIIQGIFLTLNKNRNITFSNLTVIYLFAIIGVSMTLIIFGMPRFKYPFLITCIPAAAFMLYELVFKPDKLSGKTLQY